MTYKNNLEDVIVKDLEITKTDAAGRIGVARQYLNSIFTGTRYPSMVLLQKIAAALNLEVEVKITFKKKKV